MDTAQLTAPSHILPPADSYDILKMEEIPLKQLGIWSMGTGQGFLYQDFNGVVWRIEAGAHFHFRDAGRATGTPGIHWKNAELPKNFDFTKSNDPKCNRKSRWQGVQRDMNAPMSEPGVDEIITLPNNAIMLDGTASFTEGDTVLNYQWLVNSTVDAVAAATLKIDSPTSPRTVITFTRPGDYVIDLKVTNRAGLSDIKSKRISVLPEEAPLAVRVNSEPLTIKKVSANVILDGSPLFNPANRAATYHWQQVEGPITPVITDGDKPVAKVNGLLTGTYDFQLTVKNPGTEDVIGKVKVSVGEHLQTANAEAAVPANPLISTPTASAVPASPPSQATTPKIPLTTTASIPNYRSDAMPYAHSSLAEPLPMKKIIGAESNEVIKFVACAVIAFGLGYFFAKQTGRFGLK